MTTSNEAEDGPRMPQERTAAGGRPFDPSDTQIAEAALYAAVRDLAGPGRRAARARHVRRRPSRLGTEGLS